MSEIGVKVVDNELTSDKSRVRYNGRLRRIALGIVFGVLIGLAVAMGILLALRGEQLPEITFSSLDQAVVRWQELGLVNYDLEIQLTGPTSGTAQIQVRNDETKMTLNDRNMEPRIADYWSVPGLFSVIRRDLEACAEAAKKGNPGGMSPVFSRGLFDPHYGYPAAYRRITPSGQDVEWRIIQFTAR